MVHQSKEDISDCKSLRDVAMTTKFWPNKPKNPKIAITLVVSHTSMQSLVMISQDGYNFSSKRYIHTEFGFATGFLPSWNSSETLPYTRYKGALPWQPILRLKLL